MCISLFTKEYLPGIIFYMEPNSINSQNPILQKPDFNPNTRVIKNRRGLIVGGTVFVLVFVAVLVTLAFRDSSSDSKYADKIEKWEAKQEQKLSLGNIAGSGLSDEEDDDSSGNSSGDSSNGSVSGPISYDEDYTVTTKKDVVYGTVDGTSLKIDIYTPNGVSGATPAIMYIHGGGFRGGSKNGVADDSLMLAKHGIAVVAVDYRLSGVAEFPAQIHDVKGATRFIKANASTYNIDPNKIFSLGESAGGVLASLLGVTKTGTTLEGTVGGNTSYNSGVIGVINISGSYVASIVDTMSGGIKNAISAVVDCSPVPSSTCESEYEPLSPETYIDSTDAPFIILHGDKDGSVPTIQAETLQDKLQTKGVSAELHVAPDLAHVGGLLSRYLDEVISFINSNI